MDNIASIISSIKREINEKHHNKINELLGSLIRLAIENNDPYSYELYLHYLKKSQNLGLVSEMKNLPDLGMLHEQLDKDPSEYGLTYIYACELSRHGEKNKSTNLFKRIAASGYKHKVLAEKKLKSQIKG